MQFEAKPLDKLKITQPFGVNWTGQPDFYSRFGLKGHNGIDFSAPNGTPVYAPIGGIAYTDATGYGNEIRIRNEALGYEVILGHLKEFRIDGKRGIAVEAGQEIALSDNTGYSTGPHLHLGIRRITFRDGAGPFYPDAGNGYGGWIDPMPCCPDEWFRLPVDGGYGLQPVSVAEFAPAFLYFLRTQRRAPTAREYRALRWGRWPLRDVLDPAMQDLWTQHSYVEARAKGLIK